MIVLRLALVTAIVVAGASVESWAHGGASMDDDPCVGKAGTRAVHFSAYQPQFNPSGEYCADVPKSGPTIVVFDLIDPELRKLPLELKIVKTTGTSGEALLKVPAKLYPAGVVNAEVDLSDSGEYAAVLTPENLPEVIFPLRVDMGFSTLVWIPVIFAAAPVLYFWSRSRGMGPPPGEARRKFALVK